MDALLANFSTLPQWAQVVAVIAFGASLAGYVIMTRKNIAQGAATSNTTNSVQNTATVAAVIVDNTALNRFTDTLQVTNLALGEISDIGEKLVGAHAKTPEVLKDLHEEFREFRGEMAKMREELRVMREVNNARNQR